jgi:hypothetical protein
MEVSGQFHVPAALPTGKEHLYPMYRKPSGPQSRPGRDGEEKNPSSCRESNAGRPDRSLVIILTELQRLLSKKLRAPYF